MKPEHDLRQADESAATAQSDSSDESATPNQVLPDVEKGKEAPPEQVRTVTGFKVSEHLRLFSWNVRMTTLTPILVVPFSH